jgi:hypothetical protein
VDRAPKEGSDAWRWYALKTFTCVPLDADAYPSTHFDGRPMPWPDWACRSPNGGVHLDARRGRIDVHVAKHPSKRIGFSWTCEFILFIVSKSWISELDDLVDNRYTFKGSLYKDGQELVEWATLHELSSPPLMSTRGQTNDCAVCGGIRHFTDGRVFFSDPAVLDRRLIVNRNGIFVREDEALRRNLRTPRGAFKFSLVKFKEPPQSASEAPS